MASEEGSRQPVIRVAQDLRQDAIDAVPVVESTVPISQVAAARGNRQASMRAWQQDLEEQSAKRGRWIVPHKELDCALAVWTSALIARPGEDGVLPAKLRHEIADLPGNDGLSIAFATACSELT